MILHRDCCHTIGSFVRKDEPKNTDENKSFDEKHEKRRSPSILAGYGRGVFFSFLAFYNVRKTNVGRSTLPKIIPKHSYKKKKEKTNLQT